MIARSQRIEARPLAREMVGDIGAVDHVVDAQCLVALDRGRQRVAAQAEESERIADRAIRDFGRRRIVVLPALDVPGLVQFYTDVLGFVSRGAFRVPAPPEFGPIRVRFLGINQRHHSLAICPAMTIRDPGVIHLMVEVDSLDTVGQALDRVAVPSDRTFAGMILRSP